MPKEVFIPDSGQYGNMIYFIMLRAKYGKIIFVTVFLSCVFHCEMIRFAKTCIDMKIKEFEMKIVFESGPNSPPRHRGNLARFSFPVSLQSVDIIEKSSLYDFLAPLTSF